MKIAIRELTDTRHEMYIKGFYKNPITDINEYGQTYTVQTGYEYRLADLTDGIFGETRKDIKRGFQELGYLVTERSYNNTMKITEFNILSDAIILTFDEDDCCNGIELTLEKAA